MNYLKALKQHEDMLKVMISRDPNISKEFKDAFRVLEDALYECEFGVGSNEREIIFTPEEEACIAKAELEDDNTDII